MEECKKIRHFGDNGSLSLYHIVVGDLLERRKWVVAEIFAFGNEKLIKAKKFETVYLKRS